MLWAMKLTTRPPDASEKEGERVERSEREGDKDKDIA